MNFSRNYLLAAVLVISLATNIFLAGLFVGHRALPPFLTHSDGPPPPGPPELLRMLEGALSPADAKIFHVAIVEGMQAPDQEEFRRSQDALEALLKAPSFDSEAFQDALQHIHDKHTALDAAFVRSLGKAVAAISPQGRAKLAELIASIPPPGPVSPLPSPPRP